MYQSEQRPQALWWWLFGIFRGRFSLTQIKSCDFPQVDESQTGEPGWLGGELKGKAGWFPANYAEKIPENEVPTPAKPATDSAPAPKLAVRETPAPLPVTSEPSTTPNNWADFSSTYV
jgi:hypothetical protein